MSTLFLIIDGYNLLHAAGLACASYGPGELAKKRMQLLTRIARRLTKDERKRCTVVFDAIDAPVNLPRGYQHEGLSVRFAEPGHEADELIELLIAQHSAPRRLSMVSSDHRLQTAIRRRRGMSLTSEAFLKQLEAPDRSIQNPQRPNSFVDQNTDDLNFWVQEFSEVRPDAIHFELESQSPQKNDWERGLEQLEQRLHDPDELDAWLEDSFRDPQSRKPRLR